MNPDKLLFLLKHGKDTTVAYPDFSLPAHRDEFFTWLTKERPEMWEGFRRYSHNVWRDDSKFSYSTVITDYDGYFYAWLFFSDPARPRDLMAEWLQLDSTVERFGQSKCKYCEDGYTLRLLGGRVEVTNDMCQHCNGTGKIRAEWAKYAKEGGKP